MSVKIFKGLDPAPYTPSLLLTMLDRPACIEWLLGQLHPGGLSCAVCGATSKTGNGKTEKGLPRYLCGGCGITYNLFSHTPWSGSKLGPRRIVLFMFLLGQDAHPVEIGEAVGLDRTTVITTSRRLAAYRMAYEETDA